MKTITKVMIVQIIMPFSRLSDANLANKALAIVASMVDNLYFPTPTPTLLALNEAIAAFQAALSAAANRDREQIILKNRARVNLISLLKALGNYVTFTSQGDSAMIGSTAFDIRRTPQPIIVGKPTVKILAGPNSGQIILIAGNAPKGSSFYHQYSLDPLTEDSVWTSTPTTKRRFRINGLQKTKIYWCRTAVVAAKGQLVYSDPASVVVQ